MSTSDANSHGDASAASVVTDPSASRSQLTDFTFLCQLGKGSFGSVYKVRRKKDQGLYCVKQILLNGLSEKGRKNAINEVKVLAALDHPYIIRYYDAFFSGDKLNIVMELAENGNLYNYLKKQNATRRLAEDTIWKIFIQICIGLYHIHQKKILHRDLKSLNILIDKDQNMKIGDLGCAKILDAGNTHTNSRVGTPYYLSPEMCEKKPYNDRADIWALGVILYECCTFKHPFDKKDFASLVPQIIRGKYQPISTSYSKIMGETIRTLLTKEPDQRPDISTVLFNSFIVEKARLLSLPIPSRSSSVVSESGLSNSSISFQSKTGGIHIPPQSAKAAAHIVVAGKLVPSAKQDKPAEKAPPPQRPQSAAVARPEDEANTGKIQAKQAEPKKPASGVTSPRVRPGSAPPTNAARNVIPYKVAPNQDASPADKPNAALQPTVQTPPTAAPSPSPVPIVAPQQPATTHTIQNTQNAPSPDVTPATTSATTAAAPPPSSGPIPSRPSSALANGERQPAHLVVLNKYQQVVSENKPISHVPSAAIHAGAQQALWYRRHDIIQHKSKDDPVPSSSEAKKQPESKPQPKQEPQSKPEPQPKQEPQLKPEPPPKQEPQLKPEPPPKQETTSKSSPELQAVTAKGIVSSEPTKAQGASRASADTDNPIIQGQTQQGYSVASPGKPATSKSPAYDILPAKQYHTPSSQPIFYNSSDDDIQDVSDTEEIDEIFEDNYRTLGQGRRIASAKGARSKKATTMFANGDDSSLERRPTHEAHGNAARRLDEDQTLKRDVQGVFNYVEQPVYSAYNSRPNSAHMMKKPVDYTETTSSRIAGRIRAPSPIVFHDPRRQQKPTDPGDLDAGDLGNTLDPYRESLNFSIKMTAPSPRRDKSHPMKPRHARVSSPRELLPRYPTDFLEDSVDHLEYLSRPSTAESTSQSRFSTASSNYVGVRASQDRITRSPSSEQYGFGGAGFSRPISAQPRKASDAEPRGSVYISPSNAGKVDLSKARKYQSKGEQFQAIVKTKGKGYS